METRPRPGLYLAHKAAGVTSFSLVRELMDALEAVPGKRFSVCHGGALDPFAEGLMLLLVGEATRLMELHHAAPKRYVAHVHWGAETDTGDAGGKVVSSGDASRLGAPQLESALAPFLGWTEQVPPAHSNKRVDGERAYLKAQRGEHVELPPSRVYLHSARWRAHALPESSVLELTCRGGYYVRSLVRDLGRALGCGAHLSGLERTGIGPWDDGAGPRKWLHGDALLPWLPARNLSDAELGELRAGRAIEARDVQRPQWSFPAGFPAAGPEVRAVHLGKLVGLLVPVEAGLTARMLWRGGL